MDDDAAERGLAKAYTDRAFIEAQRDTWKDNEQMLCILHDTTLLPRPLLQSILIEYLFYPPSLYHLEDALLVQSARARQTLGVNAELNVRSLYWRYLAHTEREVLEKAQQLQYIPSFPEEVQASAHLLKLFHARSTRRKSLILKRLSIHLYVRTDISGCQRMSCFTNHGQQCDCVDGPFTHQRMTKRLKLNPE